MFLCQGDGKESLPSAKLHFKKRTCKIINCKHCEIAPQKTRTLTHQLQTLQNRTAKKRTFKLICCTHCEIALQKRTCKLCFQWHSSEICKSLKSVSKNFEKMIDSQFTKFQEPGAVITFHFLRSLGMGLIS